MLFFKNFMATGYFEGVLTPAQFTQVTGTLSACYGFSSPVPMNFAQGPEGPIPANNLISDILREWSAARLGCAERCLPNLVAFRRIQYAGDETEGAPYMRLP
ncbi:hypothetical protein VP01_169g10 [Puccinia sorghi]|uniref:Uncharacterized protein n=1 Tax=Puccinia sorghi TaxID=27349 RepID=A0A0L6VFL9_9BASI|nr:hypothetical protein VP01_169g10 [Puccinia sorghi]